MLQGRIKYRANYLLIFFVLVKTSDKPHIYCAGVKTALKTKKLEIITKNFIFKFFFAHLKKFGLWRSICSAGAVIRTPLKFNAVHTPN